MLAANKFASCQPYCSALSGIGLDNQYFQTHQNPVQAGRHLVMYVSLYGWILFDDPFKT
jgi:hypothetical protein